MLASVGHAASEDDPPSQTAQVWTYASAQGDISALRYQVETNLRAQLDPGPKLLRVELSPAIGATVVGGLSLWAAYTRVEQFGGEPDEHRPWQQVLYEHRFGSFRLVGRARVEERFVEGSGSPALRLRALVRASVPLYGPHFRLRAQQEIFFHLAGSADTQRGFDQSRSELALQVHSSRWFVATLGYLLRVSSGGQFDHVALLELTLRAPPGEKPKTPDDTLVDLLLPGG